MMILWSRDHRDHPKDPDNRINFEGQMNWWFYGRATNATKRDQNKNPDNRINFEGQMNWWFYDQRDQNKNPDNRVIIEGQMNVMILMVAMMKSSHFEGQMNVMINFDNQDILIDKRWLKIMRILILIIKTFWWTNDD